MNSVDAGNRSNQAQQQALLTQENEAKQRLDNKEFQMHIDTLEQVVQGMK